MFWSINNSKTIWYREFWPRLYTRTVNSTRPSIRFAVHDGCRRFRSFQVGPSEVLALLTTPVGWLLLPQLSVRNRCVIEVFGVVFVLSCCFLDFPVGVGAFVMWRCQISSFFSCQVRSSYVKMFPLQFLWKFKKKCNCIFMCIIEMLQIFICK